MICELICAFNKHSDFNPKRSRIRIVKMERFFVDVPVVCKQCGNPQCVAKCPGDALSRDANGIIYVVEEKCTGCELCAEACPFGAISIDPLNGTAIVCDLCGGDPQCVRWCPTGALKLHPKMSKSQSKRWDAAASPARSLLKKWGIPLEEFEQYYGKL
jgi:carbon-monoxide dehydrogenase iron sulfur subunit